MYCVYLTEYYGNKMPSKYVGSSSIKRIENGYKGSVSSKKYKDIWKEEIKNNPNLFKVSILSLHQTREEALEFELKFQMENNILLDETYINRSLAKPNGYYGMDVSGNKNPMYGKKRTGEIHKGGDNISKSLKEYYHTDKGQKNKQEKSTHFSGKNHPMYGKKHTEEWLKNKSDSMLGEKNPMYGKTHTDKVKKVLSDLKKGHIPWNKNKSGIYSKETIEKMKKPKTEEHKNKLKKQYTFTSPTGEIVSVFGLTEFCTNNNLNKGAMSRLWNGKINFYKGWMK